MWSIGTIVVIIIVGLIIGALGRLVVPGRQPIPIWLTTVIGIVASFIGGWIGTLFGYQNVNGGIAWTQVILAVVVAARQTLSSRQVALYCFPVPLMWRPERCRWEQFVRIPRIPRLVGEIASAGGSGCATVERPAPKALPGVTAGRSRQGRRVGALRTPIGVSRRFRRRRDRRSLSWRGRIPCRG